MTSLRRVSAAVGLSVALLPAAAAAHPPASNATSACHPAPGGFPTLVLLSARTGAVEREWSTVDDPVGILADGRGGWFVDGRLTCGQRARLVRLTRAGNVDPSWRARAWGSPLAESDGVLFAGRGPTLLALDAASGRLRWSTRVGGAAATVRAVAAAPRAVYVAGGFTRVDGEPHPALAALDPRTGRPLAWAPPTLAFSVQVPVPDLEAVALSGSRLFIGGVGLRAVSGRRRPQIAALDAASGRLLPWLPGTAPGLRAGYGVGDVETILTAGPAVFTAGHDGFGITDARTGAIEAWMTGISGDATTFARAGHVVYLGANCRGGLTAVNGQARHNLAAIDVTTGRFTGWAPNLAPYSCVGSLAANGSSVLAAGQFSNTLG
jgi:hypothetical protein